MYLLVRWHGAMTSGYDHDLISDEMTAKNVFHDMLASAGPHGSRIELFELVSVQPNENVVAQLEGWQLGIRFRELERQYDWKYEAKKRRYFEYLELKKEFEK